MSWTRERDRWRGSVWEWYERKGKVKRRWIDKWKGEKRSRRDASLSFIPMTRLSPSGNGDEHTRKDNMKWKEIKDKEKTKCSKDDWLEGNGIQKLSCYDLRLTLIKAFLIIIYIFILGIIDGFDGEWSVCLWVRSCDRRNEPTCPQPPVSVREWREPNGEGHFHPIKFSQKAFL